MAKKPTGKNTSGRGQRDLKVKVKTARGRTTSSTRWLQRQLNDPYVKRAKDEGFRGRAAFKILELDEKYHFLKPGARVVDLGCAPGGWCQVAVPRVNALGEKKNKPQGFVLGVDLQEVLPIPPFIHRRFEGPEEQARAIENARAAGHVTEGLESAGHFHAQVLLARPAGEGGDPRDWPLALSVPPLP